MIAELVIEQNGPVRSSSRGSVGTPAQLEVKIAATSTELPGCGFTIGDSALWVQLSCRLTVCSEAVPLLSNAPASLESHRFSYSATSINITSKGAISRGKETFLLWIKSCASDTSFPARVRVESGDCFF